MKSIDQLKEKYRDLHNYLQIHLKSLRYRHSVDTACLAYNLCLKSGLDPEKGYIAGLGHDCAKHLRPIDMLDLLRGQTGITQAERNNPVLLHAKAGAYLLKNDFGIIDEDVLQAVSDHTIGRPGMGLLSQILYAADYMEPGRKFLDKEQRDRILSWEIDRILLYVIESKVSYLQHEGTSVEPKTIQLLNEIKEQIRKKDEKK